MPYSLAEPLTLNRCRQIKRIKVSGKGANIMLIVELGLKEMPHLFSNSSHWFLPGYIMHFTEIESTGNEGPSN